MASNPLAAQLAKEEGVEITWIAWAWAALVPGLLSLLVVPFVLMQRLEQRLDDSAEAAPR